MCLTNSSSWVSNNSCMYLLDLNCYWQTAKSGRCKQPNTLNVQAISWTISLIDFNQDSRPHVDIQNMHRSKWEV